MATARLSDSQKQELVQRFRQGENTQALADHFGCSSTTVTRLVRSELGEEAYGALREERQKRGGRDRQIQLAIGSTSPAIGTTEADEASAEPDPPVAASVAEASPEAVPARSGRRRSSAAAPVADPYVPDPSVADTPVAKAATVAAASPLAATAVIPENTLEPAEEETTTLAIDDADDFGDDGEDDLLSSDDDGDEDGSQDAGEFHTVAVLPISVDDQREIRPAPWSPAVLPSCAYLLVDKTVELQARPLAEMPELGRLPSEEQERQALVLFTNPRQAKRQCGRTQRVIKLPDPALLGRTAPYLLAQGISRVVIEGALYALPDQ